MREGVLEEKPNGLSPFFWAKIFTGKGLDVGSGDDPLNRCHVRIGDSGSAESLDQPDGAGDDVTQFVGPDAKYDFVHGSQVLEHMGAPEFALRSWLKILKPGGYIVATVPDWELYEQERWPSHWNSGHRSTWSMTLDIPACERYATDYHIKLPEWLQQFDADIVLCRLVDTNYNYKLKGVDQTWDTILGVEAFIEFVLRKK